MARTRKSATPPREAPAAPPALVAATPAVRVATLVALALATFAAFAGALRCGWVLWDDQDYVYENAVVLRGLTPHGVAHFFTASIGANWLPLTAVSHMLDVSLFGLAPAGHHATSLVLHVLNAVLLVLVLHRMTGAWWRSLLVGALFALHPLRVESVAWVSERKDVLSGVFFLLTLWAWARWVERANWRRFGVVILVYALGLMSKPTLVAEPFLLVVLDACVLGRLARPGRRGAPAAPASAASGHAPAPRRSLVGLLVEKWPLLLMAAQVARMTYLVQSGLGATRALGALPLGDRLCNAAIGFWRYAALTAWPRSLVALHPFPERPHVALAVLAAAALVAVTLAAIAFARRQPWPAAGWLWYAGLLVPTIGIVQVGAQAYADRYTYLPGIGLVVAIVWLGADVLGRTRAGRVGASAAALVALAACGVATARQVGVWHDTRSLFTPVLEAPDANATSRTTAREAMGWSLLREQRVAEAVPYLEAALGVAPGHEDSLRRALRGRPDDTATRRALAVLLARETRVEEAVAEFDTLIARDPNDLDAMNNVAWIRATHHSSAHRDGREAVRLAERVCALSPRPQAIAYATLGAAYAEAGRFPDAIRAVERAGDLARAAGDEAALADYADQLAFYRAGRAYHFGVDR